MELQEAIKQEMKIKENIFAFSLAAWVMEKSGEVLDLLRLYVRTGDKKFLDPLYKLGALLELKEGHNLVATSGRNVLARLLAGDTTYSGQINYGALGKGVAPVPANADIKLASETYRKIQSSHSASDNICYVDFFIANADCPNDTYTEFGNFIDGTASADSGRMFSHIATGGWVKSGSMFISCQYTIN